jgi:hypothetical protein
MLYTLAHPTSFEFGLEKRPRRIKGIYQEDHIAQAGNETTVHSTCPAPISVDVHVSVHELGRQAILPSPQ